MYRAGIATPVRMLIRPVSYTHLETFVNLDDETTAYMQDNWTGVLSYGNSSIGDIIFLIVFFLFLIGAVIFFTIKKRRDRAI